MLDEGLETFSEENIAVSFIVELSDIYCRVVDDGELMRDDETNEPSSANIGAQVNDGKCF